MTARFSVLVLLVLLSSAVSLSQSVATKTVGEDAASQAPVANDPKDVPVSAPKSGSNFLKNVARDQKTIFSSPFRIKREDLKWLVPLAATTTVLLLTDRRTSSWISPNGTLAAASHDAGYVGSMYATAGLATGLYFIGKEEDKPRLEQTGKLAFEALLDTGLVIGVLKHTMGRKRPNDFIDSGHFFEGGGSFPSGHSSNAWSVATVVAYQYKDRPLIKYGAIASAIAISLSRYSGRAHFLSEVVAGSAIGFGVGRLVYTAHH